VREEKRMVAIERIFGERIGSIIHASTGKISSVNRRYATPKVKLTGGAKFALLLLEIYLIFLVGLLAYKFWTIMHGVT
jgi:hypothetical protein